MKPLIAMVPGLGLALSALPPAATRAGEVVEVKIVEYKFVPETLTVKPETTVRWVNQEKRTITRHSESFGSAQDKLREESAVLIVLKADSSSLHSSE